MSDRTEPIPIPKSPPGTSLLTAALAAKPKPASQDIRVPENKTKQVWQHHQNRPFPTNVPRGKEGKMMAPFIRDLNIKLQIDAERQGIQLNKIAKALDPRSEDVIVGHSHRAAGIVFWRIGPDSKIQILLAEEEKEGKKELAVLGGKAQGIEHPLETAIREVREESLKCIDPEYLLDELQLSHVVATGKYTVFVVPFYDRGNIIEEFNAARKLFDEGDEALHALGDIHPPLRLVWQAIDDQAQMTSFARDILNTPAIHKYLADARKRRKTFGKR